MTSPARSEQIEQIVQAIPSPLPERQRYVIAIAGPPASGKSTVAQILRDRLGDTAAVLGMDAYHYDNAVLEPLGLLERKGSIATFDPGAYRRDLTALREHPEHTLSIPVFDRVLELSRNCAEIVKPTHKIIITEGNYLLDRHEPWSALKELFDLTVWVDAPIETVRARLMNRWLSHGYGAAEATRRTEANDLPNAQYTATNSGPATYRIESS